MKRAARAKPCVLQGMFDFAQLHSTLHAPAFGSIGAGHCALRPPLIAAPAPR
jgi:hypothetical protein